MIIYYLIEKIKKIKILLDTHAFIWWIENNKEELSPRAIELLENKKNELFLSVVSLWEMSIKNSIINKKTKYPKLFLKYDLKKYLDEFRTYYGIKLLKIKTSHIMKVNELPFYHKDPFDRMIIAQGLIERLKILSRDSEMPEYTKTVIWF